MSRHSSATAHIPPILPVETFLRLAQANSIKRRFEANSDGDDPDANLRRSKRSKRTVAGRSGRRTEVDNLRIEMRMAPVEFPHDKDQEEAPLPPPSEETKRLRLYLAETKLPFHTWDNDVNHGGDFIPAYLQKDPTNRAPLQLPLPVGDDAWKAKLVHNSKEFELHIKTTRWIKLGVYPTARLFNQHWLKLLHILVKEGWVELDAHLVGTVHPAQSAAEHAVLVEGGLRAPRRAEYISGNLYINITLCGSAIVDAMPGEGWVQPSNLGSVGFALRQLLEYALQHGTIQYGPENDAYFRSTRTYYTPDDELGTDLAALLEGLRPPLDAPEMEPLNDIIRTTLFPFQRKALKWMYDKETGDRKEDVLHPLWRPIVGAEGAWEGAMERMRKRFAKVRVELGVDERRKEVARRVRERKRENEKAVEGEGDDEGGFMEEEGADEDAKDEDEDAKDEDEDEDAKDEDEDEDAKDEDEDEDAKDEDAKDEDEDEDAKDEDEDEDAKDEDEVDNDAGDDDDVDEVKEEGDKKFIYMNELSGTLTYTRFTAPKSEPGGLLADEMGLGKTVEVLSLIASHPYSISAPDPSRSWILINEIKAVEDRPTAVGATLIVCPAAILGQWYDETVKHAPGLVARMYEDQQQSWKLLSTSVDAKWFARSAFSDCDIVFVTYETITRELANSNRASKSPLLWVHWWRVVIDEAQMVAQSNSAAATMANELWRRNGWTVTGTPFSTGVSDLEGLLTFLDHDPFANPQAFQTLGEGYRMRKETDKLRGLMPKFIWRHAKAHVKHEMNATETRDETLELELTRIEKVIYNQHAKRLRDALVRRIPRRGHFHLDRGTMGDLLKLRQICDHPQVVGGGNMPEIRMTFEAMLDGLIKEQEKHQWLLEDIYVQDVTVLAYGIHHRTEVLAKKEKWEGGKAKIGVDELKGHLERVPRICDENVAKLKQVYGKAVAAERVTGDGHRYDADEQRYARWMLVWETQKFYAFEYLCLFTQDEEALARFQDARQKVEDAITGKLDGNEMHDAFYEYKDGAVIEDDAQAEAAAQQRGLRRRVGQDGQEMQRMRRRERIKTIKEDLPALEANMKEASAVLRSVTSELRFLRSQRANHLKRVGRGAELVEAAMPGLEEENKKEEQQLAETQDDDICIICQEELSEAIEIAATPCAHRFCSDCIMGYFKHIQRDMRDENARAPCPVCRLMVDVKQLVIIDMDSSPEDAATSTLLDQIQGDFGTKISALVYDIKSRIAKDPTTKAVVFSAFKKMHKFIQSALLQNEIGAVNFAQDRSKALQAIKEEDDVHVILVPMKNKEGAAGLTLTMCNVCYLVEPSLNPGLEDQAVDRINRIGQTRPTTTVRLVLKDTVEPKIVALTKRKREGSRVAAEQAEQDPGVVVTDENGEERAAHSAPTLDHEQIVAREMLALFDIEIPEGQELNNVIHVDAVPRRRGRGERRRR
ncbi:hypothetical protein YB2330_003765 [Saitoella coloradoensis]